MAHEVTPVELRFVSAETCCRGMLLRAAGCLAFLLKPPPTDGTHHAEYSGHYR